MNLFKLTKKLFTASVVAMTIVWSLGLAALVPAGVAMAAESVENVQAGDMVKLENLNSVYYITSSLKRQYFFHDWIYKTYNADYTKVKTLAAGTDLDEYFPPATVAAIPPRPGSRLMTTGASQRVYATGLGNTRYHLKDEAAATALYGANWGTLVREVPDSVISQLTLGEELDGTKPHPGQIVMRAATASVADATTYYQVQTDWTLTAVDGALGTLIGSAATLSATNFDALSVNEGVTVTVASLIDIDMLNGGTSAPNEGEGEGEGEGEEVAAAGTLAVSLSANTPAAGSVVINVDNVVFSKFILSAGADADVIVNSVKIGRTGFGAASDFTSVTLYDGSTKLGSTKTSWHSDGYLTYNISGGWTIPAGTSKELTVVAKLDTSGTYNALGILDVSTNGNTSTGLPVYGNQKSGVDVTVGTVYMSGVGLSTQNKNIGTNGVTLAQFKLTLSSVEDGYLGKVTLKNKGANGTAGDDDIANIYLYKGNTLLAGPVSMVSDKITFVLDDPYEIGKSKNETFKIVGDIVSGLDRKVEFLLDSTTDLEVTGKTYNTSLTVDAATVANAAAGFDDTADSGTTVTTITGAELNVSLSSTALDTMDDKTDVTFGTLTLSAGSSDIKITDLNLVIGETSASGEASVYDIDEFEMLDNASGAVYSGSNDSTTGDYGQGNETWSFTDEIYLEAGTTYSYTLRGDIPASVTSTASYKISTTIGTTNITAETVPDGDTVTLFSVGSIVGQAITVKAPTLAASSITLTNANAVVNDDNVLLYKGTLRASADKIHVEQVHFVANAASATVLAIDNWSELGFYTVEDGLYVEQEKLVNSQMTTGTLDFDNLDFYIENGESVTFVVKGKLASSLTGDVTLKIDMDYVVAKDSDSDATAVVNSVGTSLATDLVATEPGSRTLTMADKGILYLTMLNTDSGFNKDRIVLAGSDFWAGKLKIRADYEDIVIEDLIVTSSAAGVATDFEDSVEELCIYSAQSAVAENLIGCTTFAETGAATFNDINAPVAQGNHYWYLYVKTNGRGTGATDTAGSEDLIELLITTTSASNVVARGVSSGYLLTYAANDASTPAAGEIAFDLDLDTTYGEVADYQTANSKKFYVAANKISNVAFVSSYGGETVNSALSGTGEYTAAILAITTEASANTDSSGNALQVGIANLRFDIDKFASTTIDSVTIQRIGGTVAAQAATLSHDNVAGDGAYDLTAVTTTAGYITLAASSTLLTDSYIEAGDTAYFVVKATIGDLSDVNDQRVDWFRFDVDDLTGTYGTGVVGDDTNNGVDWYDDAITADSTVMFNALFLDTTKLTGTKVTE